MWKCAFATPLVIGKAPATRVASPRCAMTTSMRSDVNNVQWLADPIQVKGKVQRGFGRGSRDLGTPTANLPGALLDNVRGADRDGVYVGFGCVPKYLDGAVKMVANLGRNITYGDVKERVLEAYLMEGEDVLPTEFYGEEMRLCIVGYLRPELKFNGIDELIEAIANDVSVASKVLDRDEAKSYRNLTFFQ